MSTVKIHSKEFPMFSGVYENVESVTLSPRETVLLIKQKNGTTTMFPMAEISRVEDVES